MHERGAEDERLVLASRAGDESAFPALFDRWFDPCVDVAWRILHDRDAAADVAQETFLAAWRELDRLRQPSSFGGWVLRTARNRALNRLAGQRRSTVVGDDDLTAALDGGASASSSASALPSPSDRQGEDETAAAVERAEGAELVWAASAALGERDASVLDLHLRHGFTAPEIAEALGVTANNAHQLLFRLKRKLGGAIQAWVLWPAASRPGVAGCPGLRQAIDDAGVSRFGPEAVRVIDRHAQGCDACQDRRSLRVAPEVLFGAVPILPAGTILRARAAAALRADGVPMPAVGPNPTPAPGSSPGSAGSPGSPGAGASPRPGSPPGGADGVPDGSGSSGPDGGSAGDGPTDGGSAGDAGGSEGGSMGDGPTDGGSAGDAGGSEGGSMGDGPTDGGPGLDAGGSESSLPGDGGGDGLVGDGAGAGDAGDRARRRRRVRIAAGVLVAAIVAAGLVVAAAGGGERDGEHLAAQDGPDSASEPSTTTDPSTTTTSGGAGASTTEDGGTTVATDPSPDPPGGGTGDPATTPEPVGDPGPGGGSPDPDPDPEPPDPEPEPEPEVDSFTAVAGQIASAPCQSAQRPITLTWASTGADSASLAGPGAPTGTQPVSGQATACLGSGSQSTTYTLTVTGPGGTATATASAATPASP